MKYKLLSTDLDGTLLDNSGEFSDINKKAIKKAVDMGIYVVINSGRAPESLAIFEDRVGLIRPNCYGIGHNGSVVYQTETRERIYETTMNNKDAVFIINEIMKYCSKVLVYSEGDLYALDQSIHISEYERRCMLKVDYLDKPEQIAGRVWKILALDENAVLVDLQKKMIPLIDGKSVSVFSSKNLLEFEPWGSSKGEGLRILTRHLGIDPMETIAIGDYFNDIPMIEAAGFGIAVGNARDEVKQAAKAVTAATNQDSAIAEVLETYFF